MLAPHQWDLARPEGEVRAAAVICHPHPDYGGDRHNAVVDALFGALPGAGLAALRFDFASADRDRARADADAALELAAAEVPGVPLVSAGYSFGAAVSAESDHPAVAARVLVAPTAGLLRAEHARAGSDGRAVLVLVPVHDQFGDPVAVAKVVEDWEQVTLEQVSMADHFLGGRTGWVVERTTGWLLRVLAR